MAEGSDIPGYLGINLGGGTQSHHPDHQQPGGQHGQDHSSEGRRRGSLEEGSSSHHDEERRQRQQEEADWQRRRDYQSRLQFQQQQRAETEHRRRQLQQQQQQQQQEQQCLPPPTIGQGTSRLPGVRELDQAARDIQLEEAKSLIEQLRKRIEELERPSGGRRVSASLVASEEDIDRARLEARLAGQNTAKAVALPPIEPGFKADPFELRECPSLSSKRQACCWQAHACSSTWLQARWSVCNA